MKSFVVLAFFVAAASASLGLGGSHLGGVGVGLIPIGNAHVLSSVRTIQPVAHNVITPVVTPVIRNVVTPVVSRVVSPVVVNTPVLRSIPVHAPVLTSRVISPISLGGHGGSGLGGSGLGGSGLSGYSGLGLRGSPWKE